MSRSLEPKQPADHRTSNDIVQGYYRITQVSHRWMATPFTLVSTWRASPAASKQHAVAEQDGQESDPNLAAVRITTVNDSTRSAGTEKRRGALNRHYKSKWSYQGQNRQKRRHAYTYVVVLSYSAEQLWRPESSRPAQAIHRPELSTCWSRSVPSSVRHILMKQPHLFVITASI